jgi:hypothetical protein
MLYKTIKYIVLWVLGLKILGRAITVALAYPRRVSHRKELSAELHQCAAEEHAKWVV